MSVLRLEESVPCVGAFYFVVFGTGRTVRWRYSNPESRSTCLGLVICRTYMSIDLGRHDGEIVSFLSRRQQWRRNVTCQASLATSNSVLHAYTDAVKAASTTAIVPSCEDHVVSAAKAQCTITLLKQTGYNSAYTLLTLKSAASASKANPMSAHVSVNSTNSSSSQLLTTSYPHSCSA